jgi:hypothetical protein
MAKKKEKITEVEMPQVENIVVEKKPIKSKPEVLRPKDEWEIKNRFYYLKDNSRPLSRSIKAANIFYFDEEKGYERELKYCENQKTCFVDEMKGDQRLAHIVFRQGILEVPKNKQTLQKLLSLYHPHRNVIYKELEPVKEAASQIDLLEMEVEGLMVARDMDIDMAEAIMRTEVGSEVDKMSSKELKRDLLLFAKKNPKLLLELANDENVQLRNFGIKATEMGILKLSSDQRYFSWASNNRKLMTIPFDEHPYSALAAWFKTDEGMQIYSNIEKRMN